MYLYAMIICNMYKNIHNNIYNVGTQQFKLINVITKGCTVLYLPLGCIMISTTSYFTCKSDLFIPLHTLSKYYYYPICTTHNLVFVSKSYLHLSVISISYSARDIYWYFLNQFCFSPMCEPY